MSKHESSQVHKLVNQIKRLPKIKEKATLHVIQKIANETRSGNSYLNLARLFAQTRFVALFPELPSLPVPGGLYRKSLTHTTTFNSSQFVPPLVLSSSRFKPNSPIPFGPLSPLLIEKSYPIWCSERFFAPPSRDADWEECLWQFWLNSYGNLSALAHSGWRTSNKGTKKAGTSETSAVSLQVVCLSFLILKHVFLGDHT